MQWLKTWLMEWLSIDQVQGENKRIRSENAELISRLDAFQSSSKTFSDLVWAEIAKRDQKIGLLSQSHQLQGDRHAELALKIESDLKSFKAGIAAELIDIAKAGKADHQSIAELEELVKDATIDTALAALEDRVAKIEATPAPTPGPQGRRGGSSWTSHQVAAAAGATITNGVPNPIPTPGVS